MISFCFSRNDSSFRPETRPSPLYCVILRSLRRRISARGGWVGLEAGRFFASLRMTTWRRNETYSGRFFGRMFHVKQSAEELHIVPFSNARLNHRRRPQTCLRMFQLHVQRPRVVVFMSRLVQYAICKNARGCGTVFRSNPARPTPAPFPSNHSRKSPLKLPPGLSHSSLLIPNFPMTVY